jgi:hypothetical protein
MAPTSMLGRLFRLSACVAVDGSGMALSSESGLRASPNTTAERYLLQVHIERPAEENTLGLDITEYLDQSEKRHVVITRSTTVEIHPF